MFPSWMEDNMDVILTSHLPFSDNHHTHILATKSCHLAPRISFTSLPCQPWMGSLLLSPKRLPSKQSLRLYPNSSSSDPECAWTHDYTPLLKTLHRLSAISSLVWYTSSLSFLSRKNEFLAGPCTKSTFSCLNAFAHTSLYVWIALVLCLPNFLSNYYLFFKNLLRYCLFLEVFPDTFPMMPFLLAAVSLEHISIANFIPLYLNHFFFYGFGVLTSTPICKALEDNSHLFFNFLWTQPLAST